MRNTLIWSLCFGLLIITQAFAQPPIDNQIDDPAFKKISFGYSKAENQNSIRFTLQTDNERCRKHYGDRYHTGCNPHLNLSGKRADKGITISPPIKGEWHWSSDYDLTFTPSEHWLTAQNYTITLDLDQLNVPKRILLSNNVRRKTISINAMPLFIDIQDMTYMQDPSDPKRKLVTARLKANYPIVTETLEKRINANLESEENGKLKITERSLPFDIQFGSDHMSANIAVPIKELPLKDQYLRLKITSGVQPEFGGALSEKNFYERARVPSLKTYLAIQDISAAIARNENGVPEQILSLETNVKARPDNVFKKLKLYLLPFNHPVMERSKDGKPDTPYRWKAANEITPAILEQAEPLALKAISKNTEDTTQFGFGFKAPSGRYLYVEADEGIEAFGGYTLNKAYNSILQVPEIPNDIKIIQEGSILTLSGTKKLSLHARGTDTLRVETAQILPEALQHFISQTRGDIRDPSFKSWRFNKSDIARLNVKDVKMAYVNPYASQYASFDFAPYLKENRKGIFLLNIQGMKDGNTTGDEIQRFVLVTDLGVLVKENADKSRDVFLTSFQTGVPVQNANISVLGKNGLPIFTSMTNKDGHTTLPNFESYTKDRTPVVITAQKGDDFAFIPYDRRDRVLNTSRFNVGGTQIQADGLNAFLFSDRGIYRPGETAHIGIIVKNANWDTLPPALPLKLIITNPRGRIVQENTVNLASPGLDEISLETKENWPTGRYHVNLLISNDEKENNLLGSTFIRVENFVPDRLKIKTEFSQNNTAQDKEIGWFKPDNLKTNVQLNNLYGTPASNRKISTKVTLNPARLSFKQYQDYRFYDPYAAKARRIQYDLPHAKTDKNGYAELPLKLERQEKATYSLNVETIGYEAGSGKGVTAYSTALISPMDYVIGYKTQANLSYLTKGKSYNVQIQALNASLSPLSVENLSLLLVKKTYVSTLIKREDGSYVYEAIPKEDIIQTENFSLKENGTPLSLPTKEIGDYIYRLKTKEGLIITDIPFSIAGEGQRKKGLDREAILTAKTNKTDYKAGEIIELNLSAPYTGAGLITLESDHVLAYKWFQTDKTETLETIKIPEDFSGKGYVNVTFIRNINSHEIYLSPLSHTIVPFTAGTENRTLSIQLDIPETAQPGKPFEIKYKGNKKGKALIFAIDEGILQVSKYKTPNPVNYFLLNRALQVKTSQMLDLLMPDYELIKSLSANGGGAELEAAMLGKHLNPFQRKILAPAVYWSGIVDLDDKEKTLSFTPPGHFNGELRVMAVAVGVNHIGHAEKTMNVRSDLVLTPNTPLFLAPGDQAEASVTIANDIDDINKESHISLNIETSSGIKIIKAPSENISIEKGTEDTIAFTIQATEALGPAHLIINATLGDIQQSAEATLSIRPSTANETTLQSGYTKDGKADITLMRALYPEFAEQKISVSPLPTSYIYGLLRYLDSFPYGCTEQITSRMYPQLSLMSLPELSFSKEEMKNNINHVISVLRRRQTYNGGFSLWGGGDKGHDFISIYAMDFLLEAYNADFPVPSDMMERGLNHLQDWSNQEISSMKDARNKAYAIYVLTKSGMVTSNEILHWLRYFEEEKNSHWKTDLSALYIAASYEMMQQKALAEKTLNDFEKAIKTDEISYKSHDWNNAYYNPFIKYARYVSILARHFPEHFKTLDQKFIFKLADFIKTQRYNTLSASYAIQALGDYSRIKKENFKASKILVKTENKSIPLSGETFLQADIPLNSKSLQITNSSSNNHSPFFYTLTQTGYSRNISDMPITQGLDIKKIYQRPDGSPINGSVNIGEIVEVIIKTRAHDNKHIENIALVDLLPGGFALEPSENGNASTLIPDFVERQDDRIIVFTDVAPYEQTFHYRLRAITKGQFQTPAPYAESMYDLSKRAKGSTGTITVNNDKE